MEVSLWCNAWRNLLEAHTRGLFNPVGCWMSEETNCNFSPRLPCCPGGLLEGSHKVKPALYLSLHSSWGRPAGSSMLCCLLTKQTHTMNIQDNVVEECSSTNPCTGCFFFFFWCVTLCLVQACYRYNLASQQQLWVLEQVWSRWAWTISHLRACVNFFSAFNQREIFLGRILNNYFRRKSPKTCSHKKK